MIMNDSFELTEVSGEYMAIPLGDAAASLNGIVALSEAAAFLLKQMTAPKTKDELVELLLDEYDIEIDVARHDVDIFVETLKKIDLIRE